MVAVDVGGTFTDAVAIGSLGHMQMAKVPSTPEDPSLALVRAIGELTASGVEPSLVRLLSHGTTVATNAILTGRTARVVLIASEGFRDILGFRDGTRPDIYSLTPQRPVELVARSDRLEVRERLGSDGSVLTQLHPEEVSRIVERAAELGADAIAVALLFSYIDDAHERQIATALREQLPRTPVTTSAAVAREFREFPRTATAALNAGLRPIVGTYLGHALREAAKLGVEAPFMVMQSNGGCVPAERADREAHRLLLSGPAAGVNGVVELGRRHGIRDLISLDMGGTSLDVCLVSGGTLPVVPRQLVHGYPILSPAVDIVTAGAGGGSIAAIDRGGRLRVGPESAGADPGPACYARGGTQATVTDAHVVAGTLGTGTTLAGRMALDADAARDAVGEVAKGLRMSVEAAANGILAVTLAHMIRALRRVSVERGIDSAAYTLVAFGGAGPLHAGMLLRELRLARVLVPAHPGLFSAAGLVAADLRIDDVQTVLWKLEPPRFQSLLRWFSKSGAALKRQLQRDGVATERIRISVAADCRYEGQGYELTVPLKSATTAGIRQLRGSFDELHRSVYGHANPDQDIELVSVRTTAFGDLDTPEPAPIARGRAAPPERARLGVRRMVVPTEHRPRRASVWARTGLRAGNRIQGPAIIEQMDSTTVILAGQVARLDSSGDLWINEGAAR